MRKEMPREILFTIDKKDLEISYFSGSGAGGQHRNRHMNCVRIRHTHSGVTATGQSNKSKTANQEEALNNLVNNPKFKLWLYGKVNEAMDKKTLEETVDEMMDPKNIKIEINKDGKWKDE
jgi:protein subunit release factor A